MSIKTMTRSQRKQDMDSQKFLDLRNLAYMGYKKLDAQGNPTAEPLMVYQDTLRDRESVKQKLLDYEVEASSKPWWPQYCTDTLKVNPFVVTDDGSGAQTAQPQAAPPGLPPQPQAAVPPPAPAQAAAGVQAPPPPPQAAPAPQAPPPPRAAPAPQAAPAAPPRGRTHPAPPPAAPPVPQQMAPVPQHMAPVPQAPMAPVPQAQAPQPQAVQATDTELHSKVDSLGKGVEIAANSGEELVKLVKSLAEKVEMIQDRQAAVLASLHHLYLTDPSLAQTSPNRDLAGWIEDMKKYLPK